MSKSANNAKIQFSKEASASRPMIVFGEDWGAHPSSTQHLIKVLSTQRDIVWVNSIGLRKPRFSWRDITRIATKLKARFFSRNTESVTSHTAQDSSNPNGNANFNANCNEQGEGKLNEPFSFTVVNPLVFPCTDRPILAWLNKLLLKRQLARAMKQLTGKPIVWASLPTAVDYLSLFEHQPFECDCVYYCGDDFSALAGVDRDFVATKEQELCERVSTVFAASQPLLTKLPEQKTVVIPHGVDCQLFQPSCSANEADDKDRANKTWPRDLPMGKPIAGFYGSVSEWLDQSLLAESAKTLPNWNFVLIGNIECDVSKLRKYTNIHFLEAKPHECLPQYIKHWQVAMLPFKNSQQIRMCNPLKLREYLASGTPIASTYFNALAEYQHLVEVASEHQSFAQSIVLASRRSSVTEVKSRVASVKQASWQRRAEKVREYLAFSS